MTTLSLALLHDEAGFIVSAELILIATILVLGLIAGLAEVANGINEELEDVATAFGRINQSYNFSGFTGHKGRTFGSSFNDNFDFCDGEFDISCNNGNRPRRGGG